MNSTSKPFSEQLTAPISGDLLDSLLRTSFFLSADVIEAAMAAGWDVEPIKLASSEEFTYALPLLQVNADSYQAQPSETVVAAAKRIAVSIRQHPATGKTYVITKLWME